MNLDICYSGIAIETAKTWLQGLRGKVTKGQDEEGFGEVLVCDHFDDDSSFGGKNRKNTWANILRGKTSCEKKQPSWADRVKQSSKGKSGSNKHGTSHGESLSFCHLPFPSINTGTSTLSSSFFGALLFSQMVVRAK